MNLLNLLTHSVGSSGPSGAGTGDTNEGNSQTLREVQIPITLLGSHVGRGDLVFIAEDLLPITRQIYLRIKDWQFINLLGIIMFKKLS